MKMDVELLEITKDNQAEAEFMASNFIDEDLQKRVYLNVSSAEAVLCHLKKFGIDTSGISFIHSIKRVIQKVDIADIILPNIHIDVRAIFDERKIFIPKSHFDLGIVPDIYVVLKYVYSSDRIYMLGFFEPSAVKFTGEDDNYYFIDSSQLRSPFEVTDFVRKFNHKTESSLTQEQILRGRELSIKVSDDDVTAEEFKEFVDLLSKSNVLRNSVSEYDNFETLASKVADALRVKISGKTLDSDMVDIDQFMNLDSDNASSINSSKTSASDENVVSFEDINGDSLLDDDNTVNSKSAENQNSSDAVNDDEDFDLSFLNDQDENDNENVDIESQTQTDTLTEDSLVEELSDIDIQDSNDLSNKNISEENEPYDTSGLDIINKDQEDDVLEQLQTDSDDISALVNDINNSFDIVSKSDDDSKVAALNIDENKDLENNPTEKSESDNVADFSVEDDMFEIKDVDLDFGNLDEIVSDFPLDSDENVKENSQPSSEEEDNNSSTTTINNNDDGIMEIINDESISPNTSEIVGEDDTTTLSELGLDVTKTVELQNIPDENLDTNVKDLKDITLLNENNSNTVSELNHMSEEETLVDLSDLADMSVTGTGNMNSEDLHAKDENLNDIANPEVGIEIKRDDDLRTDNDDEFDTDDLISLSSDDNNNEFVDIEFDEKTTDELSGKENDIEIPEDEVLGEINNESADSQEIKVNAENEVVDAEGTLPENQTIQPSEVSLEEFEDMIESVEPIEQNVEVDFADDDLDEKDKDVSVASSDNGVIDNSVVISDKNLSPGEIPIDINKDASIPESADNGDLGELYNANTDNDDSGLNNGVRVLPASPKTKVPLIAGIAGLVVLFAISGIILFSITKFIKPAAKDAQLAQNDNKVEQDNLGTDVPKTNEGADNSKVKMLDNKAAERNKSNSNTVAPAGNVVPGRIPSTAFLSVRKLTWEVPDYISYNAAFKQYFQSAGKSIRAALTSDLLLATDYTYSNQIRVSVTFDRAGTLQDARILLSSGSSQVDNIVLQSVNQTLKVLKAPGSIGNDQSTTVILKIYL